MKRRFILTNLFFVLAILISTILFQDIPYAQEDNDHKVAKEATKQLRASLRSFGNENIVPTMSAWKNDLDSNMSTDDLKILNQLRIKAKSLIKERNQIRSGLKDAWENESNVNLGEIKEKTRKLWNEYMEIIGELKPLAEKYKTTLIAIGEKAKPKAELWKKEAKTIGQKWWEQYQNQFTEKEKMFIILKVKRVTDRNDFSGEAFKGIRVARFMLWDGNTFDEVDMY
ncbi:MAG: hypothetical protein ABIJ37_05235 [Pseudomonadota bacterium]